MRRTEREQKREVAQSAAHRTGDSNSFIQCAAVRTGSTVQMAVENTGMGRSDLAIYTAIMMILGLPLMVAFLIPVGLLGFVFHKLKLPTLAVGSMGLVFVGLYVSLGIISFRRFARMSRQDQEKHWVLNPVGSGLILSAVVIAGVCVGFSYSAIRYKKASGANTPKVIGPRNSSPSDPSVRKKKPRSRR